MASAHCSTRVLEQCRVPPLPAIHSASLPLTFFDVLWLYVEPVERLFLYRFPHPTAVFMESYLPNLKSSLSLTLRHFYPLAGRVRLSPGSTEQFELHYADGDSVSLTVAESDLDFLDLAGNHARESSKIRSLVPRLPELDDNRALLAIQVTVFPSHGISITFAVHHAACDGFSSIHFIKSWATSCRSNGNSPLVAPSPSFDRSVVIDPCDLYSEYLRDMAGFKDGAPVLPIADSTAPSDLVHATFTLGLDHIKGLKASVGGKASTFVVSCAYLWVCLAKARGYEPERKAYFGCAVDWRKRLQPSFPDAYFGNCVGLCIAEAKASDLVNKDGVIAASKAIGIVIQGLKEGLAKNMSGLVQTMLRVIACQPLGVAGSPKFAVYGIDFGWGGPLKVEVPSIEMTGAMSLAESRDEQGGVEIGLVLPNQQMEALVTIFKNGLKSI